MTGQDSRAAVAGYALGVDLGTSNTVAVLRWPDGRTRPLLFDGQPILPSGVFLDPDGGLHVGRDAQRLAQADPGRYDPNPKRRVDEPTVLIGDRELPPADLLAAVLGAVARAAVEAVGFLPPAVVTFPAAWGARRREVLAAAVARAGWPPARVAAGADADEPTLPINGTGHSGAAPATLLVPEPVAAARYFADVLRRPVPVGASLAVFDFGGGTLDIAVVRNDGPGADGRVRFGVLGSGGVAELGGLDLDAVLVEHLGRLLAGSAPQVWQELSRPATPVQWRHRSQFWNDVRGAKEMLSRTASAPVPVPGIDQAVHLTREELERLATPLLRRAVLEAARVVSGCGLRPDQLAGLFLVGGSSRVPLVARLLHAELGVAPTVLEQPELPVAEGAIAELLPPPGTAAMQATPATATATMAATAAPAAPAAGRGVTAPGAPPVPESGPTAAMPPGGAAVGAAGPMSPAPYPLSPGVPAVAHPGTGTPPFPGAGAPPQPGGGGPAYAGAGASPYPGKAKRRAAVWIAAAATLAVLAAAGGLTLYLKRGPAPLDFVDVSEVARIAAGEEPAYDSYTSIGGDRAVLAWEDGDRLTLISVDAATGRQRWRHEMSVRSDSWTGIRAYEHLVVVHAYQPGSGDPRPMIVLDAGSGRELWQRPIYGDDVAWVYDDVLLLADNKQGRLLGLDARTGKWLWDRDNPRDEYGNADATVRDVLTPDDVAGSSAANGSLRGIRLDDEHRVVQIGKDRVARVIDIRTGKVLKERGNVGDPDGHYLAFDGQLFVAGTGGGYQLVAYDLETMGEPRSLFRAPDGNRRLVELDPCGEGRVCVLDTMSGADSVEVAAIDSAEGGQLWRKPAPAAERVVPVGEHVLVRGPDTAPAWALFDGDGKQLLRREGTAVRVNAANVLSFSGSFGSSTADLSVAGVGAAGGKATELGPLKQARGETCSWNAEVIVCMTEREFAIWRFAE